jgi:hypothetical protein
VRSSMRPTLVLCLPRSHKFSRASDVLGIIRFSGSPFCDHIGRIFGHIIIFSHRTRPNQIDYRVLSLAAVKSALCISGFARHLGDQEKLCYYFRDCSDRCTLHLRLRCCKSN